jgi:uncharacterized protein (DUF1330 family)
MIIKGRVTTIEERYDGVRRVIIRFEDGIGFVSLATNSFEYNQELDVEVNPMQQELGVFIGFEQEPKP